MAACILERRKSADLPVGAAHEYNRQDQTHAKMYNFGRLAACENPGQQGKRAGSES